MSYRAGDAVQIHWGATWFPGKIVREVSPSSWEITYDGWDASWNEVVGPERLLPPGVTPPTPPEPPPPPPVVLDGPLAGAADVPWAGLQHAYGAATDVPECLSALRSPDRTWRQRAIGHLGNALNHQGIGRCEATRPAVPFLLRLLDDAGVPDRAEIANLLADFLVGDTYWFNYYGFHPVDQTNPDHFARPKASVVGGARQGMKHRGYPDPGKTMDMRPGHGLLDIYEEVERGLPVFLRALGDGDPQVRASAAHALAFLTRQGAESAPRLAKLMREDGDLAVRASAALAMSHAAFYVPAEKESACGALVDAWKKGPATLLERRAVALALARYEEEPLADLVRPWLEEDLAAGVPAAAPPWPFPWGRLDSALLVFKAAFYGSPVAKRPPVALAAARGLAIIAGEEDASDVGSQLAFCCFGPPREGFKPTLADADEEVRVLLRALADAPRAWAYGDVRDRFVGHGLPTTREGLKGWLAGGP